MTLLSTVITTRRALALSLLLLASCGGDPAPAGPPPPAASWAGRDLPLTRWLDFAPEGDWAPALEPRTERRLLAPRDGEGWTVTAGSFATRATGDEDEPLELVLTGAGDRRVEIPGPFDPRRFNRMVVRLGGVHADMLTLILTRGGRPALTPLPVIVAEGQLVEIGFDLDDTGTSDEPFDSLIVKFTGLIPENSLRAVELIERHPAACLPHGGELDWIALGSDQRRATLLSSEQALVCEFQVSADGGRLEFAYGLPALVRYGQPNAALSVELTSDDNDSRIDRHLPLRHRGKPRWGWESVELATFAGGHVRARFSVQGAKGRAAVCALAQPEIVVPVEDPPTVICITSDTHRRDHVAASGLGVEVETPNLDALAARGILFEDATSTTNVTLPSHTAMFTGTHPRDTGILDNMDLLAGDAKTLAEAFQDAGWTSVASVSTVWLGPGRSGLGQGFVRYGFEDGPQRDSSHSIADLRRWLPELTGRPLFIWLHAFDAHTPYTPPKEYADRYYPADQDPKSSDWPKPPKGRIPASMPGIRDPQYVSSMYRAEVNYVDARIGELLAEPRFADAVVAVTADHGELLGDVGSWYNHGALAPGTLDVPLILSWPGGPRGVRVERPVQNHGIGRTLLDLAGFAALSFPGQNLLTLAEVPATADETRYSIAVLYGSASIERDGWFLVAHFEDEYGADDPPKERPYRVELFDLRNDPRCTKNLADQKTEKAAELETALFDYLAAADDHGWDAPDSIRDPVTQMHLRALGYANDGDDEEQ